MLLLGMFSTLSVFQFYSHFPPFSCALRRLYFSFLLFMLCVSASTDSFFCCQPPLCYCFGHLKMQRARVCIRYMLFIVDLIRLYMCACVCVCSARYAVMLQDLFEWPCDLPPFDRLACVRKMKLFIETKRERGGKREFIQTTRVYCERMSNWVLCVPHKTIHAMSSLIMMRVSCKILGYIEHQL